MISNKNQIAITKSLILALAMLSGCSSNSGASDSSYNEDMTAFNGQMGRSDMPEDNPDPHNSYASPYK